MAPELIIILTAILVAIPCALVGSFLVLRRMAMLGDAISHAVLPGIAIAFFLAGGPSPIPVLIGASALGLVTVTLVEVLYRSRRVKEDAAIGLVFPALFAFGVFLVSRFGSDVHLDTHHVLYGEIAYAPWDTLIVGGLDLGPKSFWVLGTVTVIDLAFVLLLYKELKLATFDPGLAAALGFSPALLHYLLMAMVSITTVAAFDSVGAILVVALLIVPAATAYLLTDRLPAMLALAVGAGAVSAVLGYFLAHAIDGSIAGAMATIAGVLFLVALIVSPRHGLVVSLTRQARLRKMFAVDLLLTHLAEREGSDSTVAVSTGELPTRLQWSPSFAKLVVEQAIAEGLAAPVGSAVGRSEAGDTAHARLTLTDRGRRRLDDRFAQT